MDKSSQPSRAWCWPGLVIDVFQSVRQRGREGLVRHHYVRQDLRYQHAFTRISRTIPTVTSPWVGPWTLPSPGGNLIAESFSNVRTVQSWPAWSPSCWRGLKIKDSGSDAGLNWAGPVCHGLIVMIHDPPIYWRENNLTAIKGLQSPWYKMCCSIDFWLFKFHSILTRFEWGPIWEWQSAN